MMVGRIHGERTVQIMKDRRGLQIMDGFRQASGTRVSQRAMSTHGMPTDGEPSATCVLREKVGSSLVSGLQASEQRLSALLHDRSRIGRELHDSVLQALYEPPAGVPVSRRWLSAGNWLRSRSR